MLKNKRITISTNFLLNNFSFCTIGKFMFSLIFFSFQIYNNFLISFYFIFFLIIFLVFIMKIFSFRHYITSNFLADDIVNFTFNIKFILYKSLKFTFFFCIFFLILFLNLTLVCFFLLIENIN